jgi:hypothetical protein
VVQTPDTLATPAAPIEPDTGIAEPSSCHHFNYIALHNAAKTPVRGLGRVGEENGYVVDYSLGQEAPHDDKEGDLDIMMVMDGTNGKGHVGGTIAVGDDREDDEDECIGLD